MKIIKKKVKLNTKDYYKTHLMIINSLLPVKMTVKEIEIVAEFMQIDSLIRFTSKGKKIVKKNLNLSDGGLSNHIKKLREKKIIIKLEGEDILLSMLFPEEDEQFYNFIIVNDGF